MRIKGNVFRFGDNIDTDVIIPARYLITSDPKELARHCMADIDPSFPKKINPGDFIVAGKNFGCGSSREHAPVAIRAAGISCVIAESYARIFYRNAINTGLPILESKEAANTIDHGDRIEVDLETGLITNLTKDQKFRTQCFPEFIQRIIQSNGLINYLNEISTAHRTTKD